MVDTLKIWENTRKTGRALLFGSLALLLLLFFWAPVIGIVLMLYFKLLAFVSMSHGPTWSEIWNILKEPFGLIGLFIVLWILSKVPRTEWLVRMVFNSVTNMAAKIWDLRKLPEPAARVEAEVNEEAMNEVEAFLAGEDFETRLATEDETEAEAELAAEDEAAEDEERLLRK